MKKILTFSMLIVLLVATAHAATNPVNINGIYYNLYDADHTAAVTRLNGTWKYTGDIVIPQTVTYIKTEYTVTSIDNYAFYSNTSLTSIELPSTIQTIGSSAFDNTGLQNIELPNGLTTIGNYSFGECQSLEIVTIPSSVTIIEANAFRMSDNLSLIKIGVTDPSLIAVGTKVFEGSKGNADVIYNNAVLEVPAGSLSAYQAAETWKNFRTIREPISAIALNDSEPYTGTADYENIAITYTRNFKNTGWQPLYIPFDMSYDEWSEHADVAELFAVHGYDTDNDGVIDSRSIEFSMLNSGKITPNVPYVIRAKQAGAVTFRCKGKKLLAAPGEESCIDCSSTRETFTFYGIYSPKHDLYQTGAYHLSNGQFSHAASESAVLGPYRFYMMITPNDEGYTRMPQSIPMRVIGDATSIEAIASPHNANDIYDLSGRKVAVPTHGIYITGGKKILK